MSVINTLFTVQGRASRQTFWLVILGILGTLFAVSLAQFAVTRPSPPDSNASASVFGLLVAFAALVPLTMITVKRLNDINWAAWPGYATGILGAVYATSEWLSLNPAFETTPLTVAFPGLLYIFAPFIVLFGIILTVVIIAIPLVLLVVGLKRGTRGANAHGADPLGPSQL